jgi:uncharacterized protein YndB with AHSA1/START domain
VEFCTSVTIDISKRHVWEALVRPEHRALWWAPGIELESQVGGRFRDSWQDGNNTVVSEGVVERAAPGEALVLSWRESSWPAHAQCRVSFLIESEGFQSKISIAQESVSGFSPQAWNEVVAQFLPGWSELLQSLKLFLHRCDAPSSHDLVFRTKLPWAVEESTQKIRSQKFIGGAEVFDGEIAGRLRLVWVGSELQPVMRGRGATLVDIVLEKAGKEETSLILTHTGFGFSKEWRAARQWQDLAWKKFLDELADEM